jgi:serine/threonine protein kinase
VTDPIVETALARVGTTLREKWRLDNLLGVGGMAAVYSSTHRNGNRVAIKLLHPELAVNQEIRQRFLREGYLANKVEHPGAVTVLDDEVDDEGAVFLVMELLDGETLADRCERKARSLAVEEILLVADQLLDVLAAAHDKKIVHRDIKPDNIFLCRSGEIKLLDFGIARLRELSTSATRTGAAMGTPAYMAPEQARARWKEVDARTDVWAVGATLFRLLTGRVVHQADTVNEQLLAAMTRPAPSLQSIVPTAPPVVVEIIDRALAFDRKDRWPDARRMQQAVRSAYQTLTGKLPGGVRLSFDDSVSGLEATVAVQRMPTALPAFLKSSTFSVRGHKKKIGALLVLVALALAYVFIRPGTRHESLSLPGPKETAPEAGVAATPPPARHDSPTEPPRAASQPAPPKERSKAAPRKRPAPGK